MDPTGIPEMKGLRASSCVDLDTTAADPKVEGANALAEEARVDRTVIADTSFIFGADVL